MTRKRPRARAAEPVGVVTGVAKGNLGTATNLEDTQVFEAGELVVPVATAPPEDAVAVPQGAPREFAEPAALPEPPPSVVQEQRAHVRRPQPRASRQRAGRSSGPRPGWAVFAAGAVAAVIVGAILGATATNPRGDSFAAEQTIAPIVTPAPTKGDDGSGGKGNGHGNGNGKGHDGG